jgi:hypothetical protein
MKLAELSGIMGRCVWYLENKINNWIERATVKIFRD